MVRERSYVIACFHRKSLEVQRSVVIEEFKQRYLNQPYGDVWLELRPLAYKNILINGQLSAKKLATSKMPRWKMFVRF